MQRFASAHRLVGQRLLFFLGETLAIDIDHESHTQEQKTRVRTALADERKREALVRVAPSSCPRCSAAWKAIRDHHAESQSKAEAVPPPRGPRSEIWRRT